MGRWRVTIAGSMGLVALAAFGFASLLHPSPLAASALFSLAVVLFFAAAIAGISLTGPRRAIWFSFALCGGGYLILSFGPWSTMEPGPHLITEPLLGFAHSAVTGHEGVIAETDGFDPSATTITEYWKTAQGTVPVNRASGLLFARPNARHIYTRDFYAMKLVPWALSRVAHSLFSLAAATAGGLFSLLLTRNRDVLPVAQDGPERSTPSFHDHV